MIEEIFGDDRSVLRQTLLQIQTLQDFGKTLKDENNQLLNYIKIMEEYVYTTKTDVNGVITEITDSFCRLSGFTRDELIGYKHNIVRHPDNPEAFYNDLWETITRDEIWEGKVRNLRKDGGEFWMDTIIFPLHDGEKNIIGYSSIRHNITDNVQLQRQLIHDPLTGIYNRRYYDEVIEQELLRSRREETPVAYIMMDIDNFKRYNDTYGHRKGDEVLAAIGKLLQEEGLGEKSYAFRMGGEEFVLFVEGLGREAAFSYVEALRQAVRALEIEHRKNSAADVVTASFGMVWIDTEHTIADETSLYSAADNALYEAKRRGRDTVYLCEANRLEMFDR